MPATMTPQTTQMGRSHPAHRRSTAWANDPPQTKQISSNPISQYGAVVARRLATRAESANSTPNVNQRCDTQIVQTRR